MHIVIIYIIAIYKAENLAILLIIFVLGVIFIREDIVYKRRIKIYNMIQEN